MPQEMADSWRPGLAAPHASTPASPNSWAANSLKIRHSGLWPNRVTHSVLTFDQAGCLDTETLDRHQRGRFDSWASTLMGRETDSEMGRGVTDARFRLAPRGGR